MSASERKNKFGRRTFLLSAGALAATPLLGAAAPPSAAQPAAPSRPRAPEAANGRRRLGSLEVSSVGLGVQNMSRTYQTTIPSRPEMFNIIRTAFDRAGARHRLRAVEPARGGIPRGGHRCKDAVRAR
jgi:hypothetical protein